ANEVVEFDHLEEVADLAEATRVLLMEDEKRGQDQAAQEDMAGRASEEGDESGVEVCGVVRTEPVSQSGARDAVLASVLPLGERRIEGVGESGMGLCGVKARPVGGLWPWLGVWGSLRWSHGSCPRVPYKDT